MEIISRAAIVSETALCYSWYCATSLNQNFIVVKPIILNYVRSFLPHSVVFLSSVDSENELVKIKFRDSKFSRPQFQFVLLEKYLHEI